MTAKQWVFLISSGLGAAATALAGTDTAHAMVWLGAIAFCQVVSGYTGATSPPLQRPLALPKPLTPQQDPDEVRRGQDGSL